VGQFSLAQFEAGPTSVAVGDPITLKIRITGKGAFDALTLPNDETAWRDFKTYPPSKKFDSTDPAQIEGSKYFEQVVTPQNVLLKEIPAFVFSYFDPEKCAFRTLTHAAIPLHVLPVAATPPAHRVAIASAATPAPPSRPRRRLSTLKCASAPWRWPVRPCGSGPVFSPGRPLRRWPGFARCSGGVKKTGWPTTRACAAAAKWRAWCSRVWRAFRPGRGQ
jgi:hypothetical protein